MLSPMASVLSVDDLPRGKVSARFEGADHGASVSFFLTEGPPGSGPAPHHHPYEEIFVIEEGESTFTVDGEQIVAGAGQIVIVPAGAVHSFVNSGDGVLRQLSIHPRERMEQVWVEEP